MMLVMHTISDTLKNTVSPASILRRCAELSAMAARHACLVSAHGTMAAAVQHTRAQHHNCLLAPATTASIRYIAPSAQLCSCSLLLQMLPCTSPHCASIGGAPEPH
jgi:hypothetical protein